MAKPTLKRKPEIDAQARKGKKGKPAVSKRDASSSSPGTEQQSSQQTAVKEETVAVKRVKKSGCMKGTEKGRLDEHQGSSMHEEIFQFSALDEFEKKKRKLASDNAALYMEKLKSSLDKDEEDLKKQLSDFSTTAAKKDSQFLASFREAYNAATPCQPKKSSGKEAAENRGFGDLHDKSEILVSEALGLVAKFEEVNRFIDNLDTSSLMDNEWGAEDQRTAGLLLMGKALGITRCQNILMVSDKETSNTEDCTEGEKFYTGENAESIWGKVARKQEKAVKRLFKATTLEIV